MRQILHTWEASCAFSAERNLQRRINGESTAATALLELLERLAQWACTLEAFGGPMVKILTGLQAQEGPRSLVLRLARLTVCTLPHLWPLSPEIFVMVFGVISSFVLVLSIQQYGAAAFPALVHPIPSACRTVVDLTPRRRVRG